MTRASKAPRFEMQRCKVKLRYQGVSLGIQPPQILEEVGEQDSLEWHSMYLYPFFCWCSSGHRAFRCMLWWRWFQCDVSICSWFRRGKEAEAQKDMLVSFSLKIEPGKHLQSPYSQFLLACGNSLVPMVSVEMCWVSHVVGGVGRAKKHWSRASKWITCWWGQGPFFTLLSLTWRK